MLLLLDSGSMHSFIDEFFWRRISVLTVDIPAVSVHVANDGCLRCDRLVPKVHWQSKGHAFDTDMRVLTSGAYDGVLGMDWLAKHSPMNCHWLEKTIAFEHGGNMVQLTSVRQGEPTTLAALDAETLWRWHEEIEIWATALVDLLLAPSPDTVAPVPPRIRAVLSEFAGVSAELS